jgi:hypothetical protein
VSLKNLHPYPSLDALPAAAQALFDKPGGARLFTSRPWYDTFLTAGLDGGATPIFFVLGGHDGSAAAVLPCQQTPAKRSATVSSLTSFYSCDFQPLIAANADPGATAFDLGRAVAKHLAGEAVIGFDSLDSTHPVLEPFLAGLSQPGRALLRYEHFGRWWENIEGLGFEAYMAGRSGALREVVRRKGARLEKAGARFAIVGPGALEQGIADYETIYAASWKEPEPFPAFQPTLMRNLARAGWLRLAICHLAGRPVAAQLWVMIEGRATVLKLAHDQEFDDLSPGTVLTAFAIRTLMESDGASVLDFGRGDDAYKQAWTTQRTPHIGVLSAAVARRPFLIARHKLARLVRGG